MRFISGLIAGVTLLVASCSQQLTPEEYIAQGQVFLTQQEWNSAIIEFKNAVKLSPDNPIARTLLGNTYVKTNNSNAAIKELNKAIELGGNTNEIMLPLGKAYSQIKQFQKVIDEIVPDENQALDVKVVIYALRATAYLALGKKSNALPSLRKAMELDENAIETRLAWAHYERINGNVSAQLKWLEPLREKDGGVAVAWSQIGEIEQNANNLETAEKAYSRSIELNPYTYTNLVSRAGVRVAQKKYDGAKADIGKLRKAGANWPIVDHIEGLIAYELEQYDVAQSHFNNALSKSPDYAPSQLLLGLVSYKKDNIESALKFLKQYLSVQPDEYRPNYVYAAALLKQNRTDDSIRILRKLKKENPDDIAVASLLASAYLSQKNSEEAIKLLTKAIETQPDNAEIKFQLGTALLAKSSTVKAGQQQLIESIKLNPDLHQASISLFASYMREKRYGEARRIGEQLDSRQKQHSKGANMIALSYLGEANNDKAIKQLNKTLKRIPNDIAASDILASLYLQQNEVQKAKELYGNVIEEYPNDLKSLNQLALISAREGKQSELIEWLKKAQERNPDLVSPKIVLATQYLRDQSFNQAIKIVADLTDKQKKQADYLLVMAQAKIGTKEYQHAQRLLRSLISRNAKLPTPHYLLAQVYGNQKKPDLMRSSLEKTIKLAPNHLSANIVLAKLDLFEGDQGAFEKRIGFLESNFPENQEVKLLKAKLASGNKDYSKAIDTLASLMSETPRSEVIMDLSRNQWQVGDKQSAIAGLELWTQEHTEDVSALMLLAQFYLAENRFQQARESYAKLDNLVSNNPIVLNNLAWLMKESDPVQGIKYAKKALSLMPDNPYIKDTLAMLHLQNGDNADALKLSKEAASSAPGFLEIQLNYATALDKNDFKDKAVERLRKLLANTNSKDTRQLIQERLAAISSKS